MSIAKSHFGSKTVRALSKLGVSVVGLTVIPDNASDLPCANGDTGYIVNDNGTGRVLRFLDVLALSRKAA